MARNKTKIPLQATQAALQMKTRELRRKVLSIIAVHRGARADVLLKNIPGLTPELLKNITRQLECDKLIRPLKNDSWMISA